MSRELPIGFYQTEHASQADRLVEAVKVAINSHHIEAQVFHDECHTLYRVKSGVTQIGGDFVTSEDATALCQQLNAQAAIAAVIEQATSAEAVGLASIAFYNDPPGHGRCIDDAMKAAILAALTGGQ